MNNMNYENFIIGAFSHSLKKNIQKGEDPAELGLAQRFDESKINSVKSAIGYCMNIYNNDIIEKLDNDAEMGRIEDFVKKIIESNTLSDISTILDDYETTVKNKYFTKIVL